MHAKNHTQKHVSHAVCAQVTAFSFSILSGSDFNALLRMYINAYECHIAGQKSSSRLTLSMLLFVFFRKIEPGVLKINIVLMVTSVIKLYSLAKTKL